MMIQDNGEEIPPLQFTLGKCSRCGRYSMAQLPEDDAITFGTPLLKSACIWCKWVLIKTAYYGWFIAQVRENRKRGTWVIKVTKNISEDYS